MCSRPPREQGRPTSRSRTIADSPLAALADVVVELGVGDERSVAATKSTSARCRRSPRSPRQLAPDRVSADWLDRLPDLVTDSPPRTRTRERFDPLADCGLLTAVGRGPRLLDRLRVALKLRELSGIPAEGFSPPT